MKPRSVTLILSFLCAITLVTTLAAAEIVHSRWRSDSIRVDGAIADWPTLTVVAKDVVAAAANDHDWLQLAIATSDPAVRQRLNTSGLVVYIDPAGKTGKTFGIHIPPLLSRRDSAAAPSITHVEVTGPAKNDVHLVDLDMEGSRAIDVAVGDNTGTLLIELGIPLKTGDAHPFALTIPANQTVVGLGLVTPQITQARGSEGGRGGFSGRGGFQGRGGRSGRGGGGGARGPEVQGTAINAWTKIELAWQ